MSTVQNIIIFHFRQLSVSRNVVIEDSAVPLLFIMKIVHKVH